MRKVILLLLLPGSTWAQDLQLHYDFRHTVDPAYNAQNDPTLYFEYFHPADTGHSHLGPFFMKVQCEYLPPENNMGKSFFQASQSFKAWKPSVYLAFQYSGGLGVTQPPQYSYTIASAFSVGPAYAFGWKKGWFNLMVTYTYNALSRPSQDVLASFYWGFYGRRWDYTGDFECYTLNRNPGRGKLVAFFGEPLVWKRLAKHLSLGSRLNLFYHVLTLRDHFQAYPTLGVKYSIN